MRLMQLQSTTPCALIRGKEENRMRQRPVLLNVGQFISCNRMLFKWNALPLFYQLYVISMNLINQKSGSESCVEMDMVK